MCSGLDPNFIFWIILAPYAQKLVESENGNRWQMVLDELGIWVQKLVALPARADALMNRLEQGKLEVRVPALSQELQRLERSQRRTTLAVVFAAFLLGGVQFYLGGMTLLAAVFGGAAVLFLILTLLTH
jgi:predicted unusual protein kinase regulating ubiquinone biosynthesis (AarF/ABC1/UbiB family)